MTFWQFVAAFVGGIVAGIVCDWVRGEIKFWRGK